MMHITCDFHSFQVEPSKLLTSGNISNFLKANDSLFNNVIKNGNFDKAAQIANAVLQAISEDKMIDLTEKSKVIEL